MWFILATLTAVFYALSGAWSKRVTGYVNRHTTTWSMFTFGIPAIFIAFIIAGMPQNIGKSFYWAMPASLVFNMVGFTLFITALKISPLSLTFPFLAFSPVFLILTGFIFLGEMPDASGMAGIVLVTAGGYILNIKKEETGILAPVKAIGREKGSVLMLIVSFIWSFGAVFDKVAVLASSPFFYLIIFNTGFFLVYMIFLKKVNPEFIVEVKENFTKLLILGTLAGLTVIFQMAAIKLAFVSYVIAIKRSGMILTLLIGGIYFREKITKFNIIGTLLMAAGVVFIGI